MSRPGRIEKRMITNSRKSIPRVLKSELKGIRALWIELKKSSEIRPSGFQSMTEIEIPRSKAVWKIAKRVHFHWPKSVGDRGRRQKCKTSADLQL
jgi:hypothetical protein